MDELELPRYWRIEGNGTVQYIIVGETETNFIAVPAGVEIMAKKEQFYSKKFDAQYALLLKRLTNGTPLKNYKSSPYYEQYMDRLKKENPEFLI